MGQMKPEQLAVGSIEGWGAFLLAAAVAAVTGLTWSHRRTYGRAYRRGRDDQVRETNTAQIEALHEEITNGFANLRSEFHAALTHVHERIDRLMVHMEK